VTILKHFVAVQ